MPTITHFIFQKESQLKPNQFEKYKRFINIKRTAGSIQGNMQAKKENLCNNIFHLLQLTNI